MRKTDRPALAAASILGLLLCAAACGGCGDEESARPIGPPSIVLISLDTTRADRLGAYGYGAGSTPTLDRLAARGVVFERAISPVPITLPAHASLLTGLLPCHHGVHDNGIHRLPDELPTLADLLAAEGYRTSAVIGAAVLDRQYGLGRGFEHYDDEVGAFGGLAIPERNATQVTDLALDAAADLSGRFLLFVHYFDPHATYRPPQPFASRFQGRPYDGEIAYVDSELERLLGELEQRGLLRNTVILVVADHGESLGEHGEPTHGVFLYDSTLRVPMLLVAPGIAQAGARVPAPVSLIDVVPTLLELAQVRVPHGLDGRSLLSLLVPGEELAPTELLLPLESRFGLNSYGWAPLVGVTDGRLKWIGAPVVELYDLEMDPAELVNLASVRPSEVERWAALFDSRWSESYDAPPPTLSTDAELTERLEKLESLGYVAAPGRRARAPGTLPDPKNVIGTLGEINDARAEMGAGRPLEAARILEIVVKRTPDNVSALILLGSSRIMAGEFAGALPALRRAVDLAPHKADAHYNLGIAQMSTGDTDGAERAWRQALEVSPRYLEAAANLIDLLQSEGRAEEARQVLDAARSNGLRGPIVDYLDGRLALQRGERERARASLMRALSGQLPPSLVGDARAMLRDLGP